MGEINIVGPGKTWIALSSVQENTCISLNIENETNNASSIILIRSRN